MKPSSANNLRTRSLEVGDIDLVIGIADTLGLSHWSRNDYLAEIARTDSQLDVVSLDGRVLGFVVARRVPGSVSDGTVDAEIYNIGVEPDFQGSGVGKVLMRSILDKFTLERVELVWLEVRSTNSRAIRFYKSCGFEESSRRKDFYQDPADDAIVMKLDMAAKKVNFL